MKIFEKIVDFFSNGLGYKAIKVYKSINSTVKYLTIYSPLITFLILQSMAFIYGEKLPQLAQNIITEYHLEGHSKFWIEQSAEFFNEGNIDIFISAFFVLIILFSLDFLDKIITLKFSQYSLKINKKYLKKESEKYITRDIEDDLIASIISNNQIVMIKGEEGIGKTILAQQIAQKLSEDYTICFFMSDEWENDKTLDNIVYKGQVNDFEKSILKEPKDIIIFLDGVNEKNALDASIQILESYDNQNEDIKNKITLVFTTRDLSAYPKYIESNWNIYKKIKLKRFTEDELERAIKKLEPSFDYLDFPKALKSIASIPRYLSLAFKLKDKFTSYENITKEMLYFEGLKEQIKQDPKIRAVGLIEESDIVEVLYDLAQTIIVDTNNKATIDRAEFKKIFGEEYKRNKTPFRENRIVNRQDIQKIELNFDIVVIAYSIYLLTFFEEIDKTWSIAEIADFFKEKLEPYDNDNMTNVPFIVFQLSLEKEYDLEQDELSKIYAGLLHLWLDNHNSRISSENLEFWCQKDLKSFIFILDGIEFDNRCNNFSRPSLKELMLEILSDRWKTNEGRDVELKEYLANLLLQDFEEERIRKKILLIRRAIKILFAYPTEDFLDIFLDMKKRILDSNIENGKRFTYKIDEFLSILFRFGYKEDIIKRLISDEKYHIFSDFYRSYTLSHSLGLEFNTKLYACHSCLYVEQIGTNLELLKDFSIDEIYQFDGIKSIACRKDLKLCLNDRQIVRDTLTQLSDNYKKRILDGCDRDIRVADNFLPLLASFDSEQFNEINQRLLFESVKQKSSVWDIEKFSLVILKNEELVDYIIGNIDDLLDIENKSDRDSFVNILMEIVLFLTSKDKVLEFFDILWERVCVTCVTYDLFDYMKFLIKEELLNLLSQKINAYHLNQVDNVELYESYMIYLYFLNDYENVYLKDWIISKSDTWSTDSKKNDLELNIFVSVLSPLDYFDSIDSKKTENRFISYWITKEKDIFKEKSVEELIEILPIDSVGKLLYKNNRFEDIDSWGVALFEKNNFTTILNYLDTHEALEVFANNNPKVFLKYANQFLKDIERIPFAMIGGIKDIIIELLLPLDLDQSIKFFDIKKRTDLERHFIKELFNIEKFPQKKYQEARKNILLNLKNDLEYLQVSTLALQGLGEEELLNLCRELLFSSYATDRLKAISIIIWIATEETITILKELKLSDDSKYIREYARWAEQVSLQEKYVREIYEEALIETEVESISPKLYQIKDALTPTFNYWSSPLHDKYCSGCNKIYVQRFLDKTKDMRKSSDKTEVYDRKLIEYYCGKKIDDDFKYITGIS